MNNINASWAAIYTHLYTTATMSVYCCCYYYYHCNIVSVSIDIIFIDLTSNHLKSSRVYNKIIIGYALRVVYILCFVLFFNFFILFLHFIFVCIYLNLWTIVSAPIISDQRILSSRGKSKRAWKRKSSGMFLFCFCFCFLLFFCRLYTLGVFMVIIPLLQYMYWIYRFHGRVFSQTRQTELCFVETKLKLRSNRLWKIQWCWLLSSVA